MLTNQLRVQEMDGNRVLVKPSTFSFLEFVPNIELNILDIIDCHHFAYSMAFGTGHQRNTRSGGTLHRRPVQVYQNVIRGKLAEFAVWHRLGGTRPCMDIWGEGKYETCDSIIDRKQIAIKASSEKAQLCLLETEDWNSGKYLGVQKIDELHFCKVAFSTEQGEIDPNSVAVQYCGKINESELLQVLNQQAGGYLHKGDYMWAVRRGSRMDANNYFIALQDFH